jgi:16S rRNA (cytidine1402-2'-O)-methyltransferase
MPGTLFIVATPIGNLEDITARALRILREVSLIAAEDTRRTAHLLTRYGITTPTTSLHEHNEGRKAPSLIARLQAGENVALVSDAGTPLISDPGQQLIRIAIEAGIRLEPVPGPSAVTAALAASGFQTHPFVFLGFPPTRSKDRKNWFQQLASTNTTAVFFESPHRIRRTLQEIVETVGDLPVMVARELTKAHESLVRGHITDALRDPHLETGELTIVLDVGHKPNNKVAVDVSGETLVEELGLLTDNGKLNKRQAIQELARRHGWRPNDVYAAVERTRKLGK